MSKPKVVLSVPCSKQQSHTWWMRLGTILDIAVAQGFDIVGKVAPSGAMTDVSRNTGTAEFMKSTGELLLQFDDDTVPPLGVVRRLWGLKVPFASGLYFHRADIKGKKIPQPMMFRRDKNCRYLSIEDYYPGEILTVDAVGMGCTLIHRSVFEAVMEHYILMQSPLYPLLPVTPEQVPLYEALGYWVFDPLKSEEYRPYPFFQMHHGRTEDYFFAELVNPLGIYPVVDTSARCDHLSEYGISESDFEDAVRPIGRIS